MRKSILLAASALLLSACASSGMHDGMVYRDGAWYSPADAGRGDYYTSYPRTDYGYPYAYDYPFDFSIGVVPYGGYCPVQYRWCTSYWPYYEPYWYQPWGYYQSGPHHHGNHHPGRVEAENDTDGTAPPRSSESHERPRPAPREARPMPAPRSGGEVRRRRVDATGG